MWECSNSMYPLQEIRIRAYLDLLEKTDLCAYGTFEYQDREIRDL